MPGPAPKSTNLKILEGNPGKRPLNHDEPQPETGAVCPDWLSTEAKGFWKEIFPVLDNCGLITKADTFTLANYCDALANYKRATIAIENNELVNEDGTRVSKHVTAQRNFADLLIKFGGKLGLSPSDRTSLKTIPKQSKSKWQQLTG